MNIVETNLKRIKKAVGFLEEREDNGNVSIKEEIKRKRAEALALAEALIKEIKRV